MKLSSGLLITLAEGWEVQIITVKTSQFNECFSCGLSTFTYSQNWDSWFFFWDGFSNEMRGVFKPLKSYRILSPSCLTPNKSSRLHGFLRRDGESMPEPLSSPSTATTAMAVWGASAEPLNEEPTKEVDGGCFSMICWVWHGVAPRNRIPVVNEDVFFFFFGDPLVKM